jgi:hypothetical protein
MFFTTARSKACRVLPGFAAKLHHLFDQTRQVWAAQTSEVLKTSEV